MTRNDIITIKAAALALLAVSPTAHAYLDPGTGSMLLQLLIAGILGALFTVKMWWYRFKLFCTRLMGRDTDDEREPASRPPASDEEKKQAPE